MIGKRLLVALALSLRLASVTESALCVTLPRTPGSYPDLVERAARTDERLDDLARRMDAGFARVDADNRELRHELRTEIRGLRTELRGEIGALRLTILRVGAGRWSAWSA